MGLKLTFTQRNSESGAVNGSGIDWWWTGRDFYGNEEAVEDIGQSCEAALREEWDEHLVEDEICELPFVAEVDWNGDHVEDVMEVTLNFEFDWTALRDLEQTLEDIQVFFSTPVVLDGPLQAGENKARVGDKEFTIKIDSPPDAE